MARRREVRDGDFSERWRVVYAEQRSDFGPIPCAFAPLGFSLRPNENPSYVRECVALALSWPEGQRLGGSTAEAMTVPPEDITLYEIF